MIERLMDKAKDRLLQGHETALRETYVEELEKAVLEPIQHAELAGLLVALAPKMKIQCIRILKLATGLGLKDAKDLIDQTSQTYEITERSRLERERMILAKTNAVHDATTAVAQVVSENITDLESIVGADRLGRDIIKGLRAALQRWSQASQDFANNIRGM